MKEIVATNLLYDVVIQFVGENGLLYAICSLFSFPKDFNSLGRSS